jgi:Fe-S-cluster containining protein
MQFPAPTDDQDLELVKGWLAAVTRAEVRSALESVYAAAAEAIAARGPACWASGRCCNFEKTGHLLYVTGLEAAYALHMLGDALAEHASQRSATRDDQAVRTLHVLPRASESSAEPGACPFQSRNLCTIHAIKPLGCRVYFCDRSAQQWQNELSERLLAEIRGLHDGYGLEYRYGEWRGMLRLFESNSPLRSPDRSP